VVDLFITISSIIIGPGIDKRHLLAEKVAASIVAVSCLEIAELYGRLR